jgi:hypothetical protein
MADFRNPLSPPLSFVSEFHIRDQGCNKGRHKDNAEGPTFTVQRRALRAIAQHVRRP